MSARKVRIECKDFMCDTVDHPSGDRFIMMIVGLNNPIDAQVGDEINIVAYTGTEFNCEHTTHRDIVVTAIKQGFSNNVILKGLAIKPASFEFNQADPAYLAIADKIKDFGSYSGNRTDTNTFKMFGNQLVFDLRKGIPVLTSKKVNTGALIKELLWFCRGETNINTLGSKIWDQWATKEGELGPVYGAQWRFWQAFNLVDMSEAGHEKYDFLTRNGYKKIATTGDGQAVMFKKIDQLGSLINSLRNNPNDRRMIVTAWNPAHNPDSRLSPEKNAELGMQALPPCHTIWHVGTTPLTYRERLSLYLDTLDFPTAKNIAEVTETSEEENTVIFDDEDIPKYYLDLLLYQRSADWFIGVPFNIASYSILQCLIAHTVNMVPRNFIHTFGDYHIYENHLKQIELQMKQEHKRLPTLKIHVHHTELADYKPEDIELVGYEHGPVISGEVAK